MAFEKLEFTKNWENAADFPAIETSEAQVRKDMQVLHDETRDALNSVVQKLNTKKLLRRSSLNCNLATLSKVR